MANKVSIKCLVSPPKKIVNTCCEIRAMKSFLLVPEDVRLKIVKILLIYHIIAFFHVTLISRIWNRNISQDLSFATYREKCVIPLNFSFKVLQILFHDTLISLFF